MLGSAVCFDSRIGLALLAKAPTQHKEKGTRDNKPPGQSLAGAANASQWIATRRTRGGSTQTNAVRLDPPRTGRGDAFVAHIVRRAARR
jgi:hypothetical protein